MMTGGLAVEAQQAAAKPMTRTEKTDLREQQPLTTFYLKHASQPNDGNEILTTLRLMLDPGVKLFLVASDNAIVLKALPDEIATAAKLIGELDVPRKVYRLTYTLNEMDGGKRVSSQHYTEMVSAGQRETMKEGTKVPVITGKFNESSQAAETQATYLDVGLNFDTTASTMENGVQLKWKVERSSVAEDKPAPGGWQNPTIRQVVLDGVSSVKLGKATMLGGVDVPDSTRRVEVEVTVDAVP